MCIKRESNPIQNTPLSIMISIDRQAQPVTEKEEGIITVYVTDRENNTHELDAPTDMSLNLMEVIKSYELPIAGICGGMALCASCHCYVESDHSLPAKNESEELMLDETINVEENSRLSCQIRIAEDIDGLKVRLAPE